MKLFKSKKEREEEKEFEALLKEEEKKEEELEEKLGWKEFVDLVFEKEDDSELIPYMTDEDKKAEEEYKKENKRFTIIVISILACLFVIGGVALFVFQYHFQSDIDKYTKPMLIEYYKNKYGEKITINDIDYICYNYKDEENNIQEKCSDILLATTSKNTNIIMYDNLIGDNNDNSTVYEEYKNNLISILPSANIINNNPLLSYYDYFLLFNQFYDYIDVLPNGYSYNDLYSSNKLNVIDTIIYDGEIDIASIQSYMSNLSEFSRFNFIKVSFGIPTKLTIIDVNDYYSIDITSNNYIFDNIINYNLDLYQNNIGEVNITKITDGTLSDYEKLYSYYNSYEIDAYNMSSSRDFDRTNLPSYYLLAFTNNILESDIYEFSGSSIIDVDNYVDIFTVKSGDTLYLIGTKSIGVTNRK